MALVLISVSPAACADATRESFDLAQFDVEQFVQPLEPTCLRDFSNRITVPAGERVGYTGDPPPNTVVDMRGVTVKFAPPGENGWRPENSDNVCVHGGRFVGQSDRTIGWLESKKRFDGSGIRVSRNEGPFIWEQVVFDNSHDGIMLPRAVTPDRAAGIVRSAMILYNRDDCIENDGSANVTVLDSFFECNTFFSATGGPGDGRTVTIKNSIVHMKCLPDDRDRRHPCTDVTPRSALSQLWKVKTDLEFFIEDSILYYEDRTKLGLSAMFMDRDNRYHYKNVVLVWGGDGPWPGPGPLPDGVTLTSDTSVFETAKAEWMRVHGCDPEAATCTWDLIN